MAQYSGKRGKVRMRRVRATIINVEEQ